MQAPQIHRTLSRGKWYANLSAPLQSALAEQGQVRQLPSGQRLFSRGDCADGIYAVLSGCVQIVGTSRSGVDDKSVILTLIEPPDWFGEICLFDRQPRTHDAIADEPATLLHVRQHTLDTLFAQHPHYWREFGLLLTQKIRLMFGAIEDAALLPTPIRLIRRLVQMTEGYGIRCEQSGILGSRTVNVSQEKLSSILAISRQTVNQILKELENENLIGIRRGSLEILDLQTLKQKAQL